MLWMKDRKYGSATVTRGLGHWGPQPGKVSAGKGEECGAIPPPEAGKSFQRNTDRPLRCRGRAFGLMGRFWGH